MPIDFFIWALSLAMGAVIFLDATRYLIPNWLNLSIAALFVAACFVLPVAILPSIGAALLIFVVGLGIFALGLMGGGDVKLLTAVTLWTGWSAVTGNMLLLTGLFGGLLVLIILPLRRMMVIVWPKICLTRPLPRFFKPKEPTPYGLAIASAFLFLLWTHHVPLLAG